MKQAGIVFFIGNDPFLTDEDLKLFLGVDRLSTEYVYDDRVDRTHSYVDLGGHLMRFLPPGLYDIIQIPDLMEDDSEA